MSRRLPVIFKRINRSELSDFDDNPSETLVDIGPGDPATEYRIGAVFRHLTDADKTERGYNLSQDAIELSMPYTETLNTLTNRGHVAQIYGEQWNVLSIDKLMFRDRKIKVVVGRNL